MAGDGKVIARALPILRTALGQKDPIDGRRRDSLSQPGRESMGRPRSRTGVPATARSLLEMRRPGRRGVLRAPHRSGLGSPPRSSIAIRRPRESTTNRHTRRPGRTVRRGPDRSLRSPVTYVRLSVTDRCDLRCVYCMSEKMTFLPRAQLLTLEEIARLGRLLQRARRHQAADDRRRAAGAAQRDLAVRAAGHAAERAGSHPDHQRHPARGATPGR